MKLRGTRFTGALATTALCVGIGTHFIAPRPQVVHLDPLGNGTFSVSIQDVLHGKTLKFCGGLSQRDQICSDMAMSPASLSTITNNKPLLLLVGAADIRVAACSFSPRKPLMLDCATIPSIRLVPNRDSRPAPRENSI